MFPHLFQHWLTAKSAKAFRLTVIAHPLCIMIVWVPCVLVGAWASGVLPPGIPPPAVLSAMLKLWWGIRSLPTSDGWCSGGHHVFPGLAISLFGTIFTNDIVLPGRPEKIFRQAGDHDRPPFHYRHSSHYLRLGHGSQGRQCL